MFNIVLTLISGWGKYGCLVKKVGGLDDRRYCHFASAKMVIIDETTKFFGQNRSFLGKMWQNDVVKHFIDG